MADTRTMSELLQAPTEGYGDAIVIPAILAEDFELKVGLLQLVTSSQFHGFERDDPHAHIRWFNKITSMLKYKNVPHDAIKLMLFPFSLEVAVRTWLEKEPPRSIHTWKDLVSKFVNYFFPPSKTTNLKNDLTNFQQKFDEMFSEAWDHFKDLLRSHETFQCQPTDQNVDLSGDDQIQNPHYPDVQENPLTNDEFKAYRNVNDANMNDLEFKLDNFQKNQKDFQEKFEQMQDDLLNQMRNFMQNLHDGPPDSDIHQLIEECSTEVSEKQKMEDTMFELVKISQEKEFLCIHDDIDDLIESSLDSKLLLINSNSQRLDKKEVVHKSFISSNTSQISLIHSIAPVLSTKEPEHLLSMGYEHLSITPETESDEVTKSNVVNLLPIPSECEVALEDKRECDVPISENSPVYDNSDTFSDSIIDDDISIYDDDFEDIEYVEALLSDPEIVSVEEENAETEEEEEEEEVNFEDISQIQDFVLREKLLSIIRLIFNIESLNENSTPDLDLFLSDDSMPPGIKNITDDPEGDIRFMEELLINDFILSHESFDSNFEKNPSIPRPPSEPPATETDAGEEISFVMNDKDEDVYSSFIFVIFAKMFSLLSAESEDTIFDPANPRGDMKDITTRSGVAYEGPSIPPTSSSLPKEVERELEVTRDKKKLSLPDLTPTRMTLELATRSIAYPVGIAEDVFVQVGKFTLPVDFIVVDYDIDPRVPLILGRPFLRTARALAEKSLF
uniref:Reverse transcriptase domain-containing protein n=1 Tax=Tanacetum cinerariifolium TaxID=118510 RepID=A0A6L2N4A1_TANCI|nr:reverse transcriptase domain-containing protein [Tanacetum cinerariifolium]